MIGTDAFLVALDWFIITVFLFFFVAKEASFSNKLKTASLAGLISAACVLLTALPSFLLFAYLIVLTLLLIYVGQQFPNYYYESFIVLLLTMLAASMPGDFMMNGIRAASILAGGAVTIIIRIAFSRFVKSKQIRYKLMQSMRKLDAVSTEIFSCLLQPDYPETVYLFERRLHKQKNDFMQSTLSLEAVLKQVTQQNRRDWGFASLETINNLYSLLLECAMVRWRVTDPTMFALCRKELFDVYEALCGLFLQMTSVIKGRQIAIDPSRMQSAIRLLEENYQNVLQVAAKEPLVILLFIDSLKLLSEQSRDIRGLQNGT